MADKPSSSGVPPRKMRFMPKNPPKNPDKLNKPKLEQPDVTNDVIDSNLLNLVKNAEKGVGRKPFTGERKNVAPSAQVAFGHVNAKPASASLGIFRNERMTDGNALKVEKEYDDPWDYDKYYPITLPLRLPHMGNPETLNEAEFGKEEIPCDETLLNPANELGLNPLMEDRGEEMIFVQLPSFLPLQKQPAAASSADDKQDSKKPVNPAKPCSLEDLPGGYMGKLIVYKSGAVKMKLGDTIFNVSPGSDSVFAQNVMAINTEEKHCCVLGELGKRAIVTPDLDSLLNPTSEAA